MSITTPNNNALKTNPVRKTKYAVEDLLANMGKRDKSRVKAMLETPPTLSTKETNKLLQRANSKDQTGLRTLELGFWHAVVTEATTGDQKSQEKNKQDYLELIKLNKTKEGKKALYKCLSYEVLKPLMKKYLNFLNRKAEDVALQEFEKALISSSKVVLEINGRRYVEQESIKKCLKATPQEMKNLGFISQETHTHENKKLLPIDSLYNAINAIA